MKYVACCLYGYNKNVLECYTHVMNYLRKQTNIHVDFYYYVWILPDVETGADSKHVSNEIIHSLFNPKAYGCENARQFPIEQYQSSHAYRNSSIFDKTHVNTMLSDIYSMQQVRNILVEYSATHNHTYDHVLAVKFDMVKHPALDIHMIDAEKLYVSNKYSPRKCFPFDILISSYTTFMRLFQVYDRLSACIDNTILSKNMEEYNEPLVMNTESLCFANYIDMFGDTTDIVYTEMILDRQNTYITDTPIRIHIPGIPHTITTDEFSHCAFTGKVKRISPMMRSVGFEVYHYGVETSESGANVDIQLFTKAEWMDLRMQSMRMLHPDMSHEELQELLANPASFVGNLANVATPLYKEFNARFRKTLQYFYRSTMTDIVCLPFGVSHNDAIHGLDILAVESGIGYYNSFSNLRIFESYAVMNYTLGKQDTSPNNYWFVIPNYYDIRYFPFNATPLRQIGFLGRLGDAKGCNILVEVAKRFPEVQFILCGQGDATPYLTLPNISYKPPIHGTECGVYLGSLTALLAPTSFLEPFCGVVVEAQLCGTPVVCADSGAMAETVEQFQTGIRCHTLADYCYGVRLALDGVFQRRYIHERAVRLYDMYAVAHQYKYAFSTMLDLSAKDGWYSNDSHLVIPARE